MEEEKALIPKLLSAIDEIQVYLIHKNIQIYLIVSKR